MLNYVIILLPPYHGLLQHTKRACLQAGWLWYEGLSNVNTQDPENWGWTFVDKKYVPKW